MNKYWILLVVLICSLSFGEEEKFTLPDLFVTAKDVRKIDSAERLDLSFNESWRGIRTMVPLKSYIKQQVEPETMPVSAPTMSIFYNDAAIWFAAPSYLSFRIRHGYVWENLPYFIMLERRMGDGFYMDQTQERGFVYCGSIR